MRKNLSPPTPKQDTHPAEFSRLVVVARIGHEPQAQTITAQPAERAALALRLAIPEVRRLVAEVSVARNLDGETFRVDGRLTAEITETCVVSLEPFESKLDLEFSRLFREGAQDEDAAEIDPESDDPPDLVIDGSIDIGEVATEELALGLAPYPRKPDSILPPEWTGSGSEEVVKKPSPFAVLAKLKEKKDAP